MQFDPENPIVQLCARGMELEGENPREARKLFQQAWNEASTDWEKFTSAHYIARHQESVTDKLKWDQVALDIALRLEDDSVQSVLPSLFLNVGKCYEDLGNAEKARENYNRGLSFTTSLPDDGYGKLIHNGLLNGLERVS
ncbi:MAG TPA: hypothetical protein VK151_03575 [Fluviicola sp.]|nr:hypothetical protein [Fluviicola sp.]